MKTYWLEAADVLFFRDGRSFDAGESHGADGSALPAGSVVAGALRSALLAAQLPQGKTLEDYGRECGDAAWQEVTDGIGTPSNPYPFALQGPFPARRSEKGDVEAFFPWPRDMSVDKSTKQFQYLVPGKLPEGATYSQDALLPLQPQRVTRSNDGEENEKPERPEHFSALQLAAYLAGEGAKVRDAATGWDSEERVGIERGPGGGVKIGRLYSAKFLRFAPGWGLTFAASVDLGNKSLLKLGGEHRAAFCEALQGPAWEEAANKLREAVVKTGRLRLYCASETAFAQGWLPDAFDPETLRFKKTHSLAATGAQAKLAAVAAGKAVSRQGWDLAAGAPKAVVRCAPAGSVYFLECLPGEGAGQLFDLLHGTCLWQETAAVADAAQRAAFGGGLTFCGIWNYGEEE